MRRAPKDYQLAEKIGNAYVKCHLYNKVKLKEIFGAAKLRDYSKIPIISLNF